VRVVLATTALRSKSSAVLGVFAILAATACWSSGGVLVKNAHLPGVIVAFWRLVIVAAIFGAIALATRRRVTMLMLQRSLVGGLLFGVNLAVWFEALRYTTVGIATVMAALVPVFALIVGNRFFDERITRIAVFCAIGAIGGVVLFVVPGFDASGTETRGLALSFVAVTLWVAYLFATKRARQGVGTVEYLFCMAAVAAASLVPFMVLVSDDGLTLPSHGWGWIIALAVIPGSIGHGLLAWAQAHVPMSAAGILLQGEPIGAAIAGAIFLNETLGPIQGLGLFVAFVSLAVLTRSTTSQVEAPA
jgi:drug/metabolite transporter (DMT)-like permease